MYVDYLSMECTDKAEMDKVHWELRSKFDFQCTCQCCTGPSDTLSNLPRISLWISFVSTSSVHQWIIPVHEQRVPAQNDKYVDRDRSCTTETLSRRCFFVVQTRRTMPRRIWSPKVVACTVPHQRSLCVTLSSVLFQVKSFSPGHRKQHFRIVLPECPNLALCYDTCFAFNHHASPIPFQFIHTFSADNLSVSR